MPFLYLCVINRQLMSTAEAGFRDAYRDDILALVTSVVEAPLFRAPTTVVSGTVGQQDMDAIFQGKPLGDIDPRTPEGLEGEREAKVGFVGLAALRSVASMHLLVTLLNAPQQEKAADEMAVLQISEVFKGCTGDYIKYDLGEDTGAEKKTAVTSSRLSTPASSLLAREVKLSIVDTHVERSLIISQLPTSLDAKLGLSIKQVVSPVMDELETEAAVFFLDNNDTEGPKVLRSLFVSELRGTPNHDVEDLLARYECTDKLEKLEQLLNDMRQKAAAVQESSKLIFAHPGIESPSAANLDEYQKLIAQIYS